MNLDSETALRSRRKTASSPASSASFSLSDFFSAAPSADFFAFVGFCSSCCSFCCWLFDADDEEGSECLISFESRFSRWFVVVVPEDRLGGAAAH